MYSPPLAIALTMPAICTGVAVKSPCPKEKLARAFGMFRLSSVGRSPAADEKPGAISTLLPKPRFCAINRNCACGTCCITCTK